MNNKYEVLASFTDGEDKAAKNGENSYYAGGEYPREGHTPSEGRIKTLQGSDNRLNKPVIASKPVKGAEKQGEPAAGSSAKPL
jgi:hypothetical protein